MLTTKYVLGSVVTIPEFEVTGKVRAIQLDHLGLSYKVTYFLDSRYNETWFFEDDLK